MSFRLRADVDDWFKNVMKKGPLQTKFDVFYLCLMMGLATGRAEKPASAQEFIDTFVADYKAVQRLIIGVFLIAETSRLGIDLSDREDVQKLINEYLDPTSPAHLREAGFGKLNDYANGGFAAIVEAHGGRPHQVETFVRWYARQLAEAVKQNPTWASFSSGAELSSGTPVA